MPYFGLGPLAAFRLRAWGTGPERTPAMEASPASLSGEGPAVPDPTRIGQAFDDQGSRRFKIWLAILVLGILALAAGDLLTHWHAELEILRRMPERPVQVTRGTTAGSTARH